MDCKKGGLRLDTSVPPDRTDLTSSTALQTTLGLLPILAFSAAVSGSAYAQAVDIDEITVGGGGTPAPAAAPAPEEEFVAEPAEPAPSDLSLRDGGGENYNVGQSTSTKSTAPLLNTPQTVTVIPGTIIDRKSVV